MRKLGLRPSHRPGWHRGISKKGECLFNRGGDTSDTASSTNHVDEVLLIGTGLLARQFDLNANEDGFAINGGPADQVGTPWSKTKLHHLTVACSQGPAVIAKEENVPAVLRNGEPDLVLQPCLFLNVQA